MKTVALTSLRFLALYVAFLAVFLVPPVLHVASGAVAWVGALVLRACWGAPAAWSLTDAGIMLGSPSQWLEMDALTQVRNLPLFWAIVLAVARVRRMPMLLVLTVGSAALVLLDGIIIAGDVWTALDVPANRAFPVVGAFNAFHNTGGMSVAPTFIGALIALTILNQHAAVLGGARRNDACPCGSGQKLKRCCGA